MNLIDAFQGLVAGGAVTVGMALLTGGVKQCARSYLERHKK